MIYFVYLGSVIACNGSMDSKLNLRIGKDSGAFSLNKIWNSKEISRKKKIRIYESAVLTIMLHAAETWQSNNQQIHRLEVFHQSCLRRILKVKFFHHVRNTDILQRTNQSHIRILVAIIRLRCFVSRMDESFP